jgi:hypothetical protein
MTKTHTGFIDDFFYSYGIFQFNFVDPSNAEFIYQRCRLSNQMMAENILKSISEENVHSDHPIV